MKKSKKNILAITHPEIAKQWHPTKNHPLTPFDVTFGSTKKVWWKCDKSDDHEWDATINNRTNDGNGCPYCSGHAVVLSNCLATTHPELAKQWHSTKNLSLTPFDVTFGTAKKIWWKCSVADDHEWKATTNSRTNGNGCPCCFGQKVVLSNCLATTHSELAKQWHPTKNLPMTPFDVRFGSHKKVWWKCDVAEDHEWKSCISSRTRIIGNGCPCCSGQKVVLSNCLSTTYPEIAKQWHLTKNLPLTPFDVLRGSNKKVWWKCDVADNHEWKTSVNDRTNGYGCPFCNESHGEKEVKNILNKMNIYYDIEKTFDGCKYKNKLEFDFYLPKYNILIEYDGRQHFKPIDFFGGIDSFKNRQRNDEIKNKFSLENNIPLLRIPYTKFNSIEEEIKSFIASLTNF